MRAPTSERCRNYWVTRRSEPRRCILIRRSSDSKRSITRRIQGHKKRMLPVMHSTTILCVRRNGQVAIGGDGQVTVGETVMKANANKARTLKGGKILAGFAGAAADAFTLFEKFEEKLERYPTNLPPSAAPSPPSGVEETLPWLEEMPPKKIVAELDRYIVGQDAAKKAVAIAVRNRWRRSQTPEEIRDEIMPNNIIMIGPTGVGKTEIARRLARLAGAPFLKVEASKFTEVGYVGRDVESMVRELVDVSINMVRSEREDDVYPTAEQRAEERLLDLLLPPLPQPPSAAVSSAAHGAT